MRRLLVFSLLVATTIAFAQSVRNISVTGQLATFASAGDGGVRPVAADFTATKSLDLGNLCGYRLTVCAADTACSTQSCALLTGGTLKPWMLRAGDTVPSSNTDLNLTVGTPLAACRTWPDQRVAVLSGGKLLYATSALTGTLWDGGSLTADGGNFTVRIDGWTCP